ncbi:hypothetical protein C8R46DRAFT_1065022 [Mycena filopes]|nr:hypothetical protein C8R46DRAFT_1065022 [Mycena filopes]
MSAPNQPPNPNPYAQPGFPPAGAPGGFAPVPGQAPYPPAGGGYGAPPMPGYQPPGNYYPPAPGYAPAGFPGYGAPPPPMPGYAPPQQGFPPQQYPPQQGYPGYQYQQQQQQQTPGYNPAYGAPPQGAYPPYAVPPGAPPPGGSPMPGTSAPGSMPGAQHPPAPGAAAAVPGAPAAVNALPEPPTVVYRDIIIHNPRFAGGLNVWGYERDQIKRDIDEIIKHGGSEKRLIEILTRLGPLKMEVLSHEFHAHNPKGETLYGFIERKTARYVEKGLLGLVLGPLKYDAERVQDAIKPTGGGTKEDVLNEIILDLTPSDVGLLAYVYEQKYKTTLLKAVRGDLSGGVEKLFVTALNPKREYLPRAPADGQAPVFDAAQVTSDVKALKKDGEDRPGTHEQTFFNILTGRSHQHLLAVARDYPLSGKKKPLSYVIQSEFSGDERDALLYIVRGLEAHPRYPDLDPRVVREVTLLEETMKGMGTNDGLLVMRLLRAHWARWRMDQIAAGYLRVHEKTLTRRVQGETSGAFEDLLVALIKGPATAY